MFKYTTIPGLFTITVTESFIDMNNLLGVGLDAVHLLGSPNFQHLTTSILSPRIEEDLFYKELKQAYIDANVAEIPAWVSSGSLPSCLAAPWGSCPDESNWCSSQTVVHQSTKSHLLPSMQMDWPW